MLRRASSDSFRYPRRQQQRETTTSRSGLFSDPESYLVGVVKAAD
jgi:hypothetical protein